MRTLYSISSLLGFHVHYLSSKLSKFSFLHSFSSVASLAHNSNSKSKPFLVDYLIQSFGFSETQALSASKRFPWPKTPENPESIVRFLRQVGFLETQIRSAVRIAPQILFADIDKTLKPKLEFFQELGLTGSDLGRFFSRHSTLLTVSLDRRLIPCIKILKKILCNNNSINPRDLILVVKRCNWIISKHPESRLSRNVSFLESHGIIGSQLSMLLKRQPSLFVTPESTLKDLVQRVLDLGFSPDSRMFVHALITVSSITNETLLMKFELFKSFGFSEMECLEMFRRAPNLFKCSAEKLKLGMEFFMETVKFDRGVLIHQPTCLMHSVEERTIPRYRVVGILKSKRLLKKQPSFVNVLRLAEEEFMEKFILRFRDDAVELLEAYKGHVLDSLED